MSKIITIIGATGQQGGSAARVLLETKQWKVRAVTRNPNSEPAKALAAQGAELVIANVNDEASLVVAFQASNSKSLDEAGTIEEAQGRALARAAARKPTLEHYIWSTIPDSNVITGGRIRVAHWDHKARVDVYIQRELPLLAKKTSYLYFGMYSDTILTQPLFTPLEIPGSSGKFVWLLPTKATASVSLTGDIGVNPGIWVRQLLAHPEKSLGKYAAVFAETKTFQEYLDDWNEVTGKAGVLVEVSGEDFTKVWGHAGADIVAQLRFGEEFIDWTAHVKNKFVGPEELEIKLEKRFGTKQALKLALGRIS
ncbi:hypothetical protein ACHAP3_008852 [Botrytis cinerea]